MPIVKVHYIDKLIVHIVRLFAVLNHKIDRVHLKCNPCRIYTQLSPFVSMGDLDLDEYIPIKEETSEEECPLCLHNDAFLTMQHRILMRKCSKRHLYDLLFQMYQKRMKQLRQQNMKTVALTRKELERHFEQHSISYPRSLQEDIRICKALQNELLGRMKHSDGSLEVANISLWKSISTYKLGLLKKLSTDRVDTVNVQPYVFD
jgi:hypothetical protein